MEWIVWLINGMKKENERLSEPLDHNSLTNHPVIKKTLVFLWRGQQSQFILSFISSFRKEKINFSFLHSANQWIHELIGWFEEKYYNSIYR